MNTNTEIVSSKILELSELIIKLDRDEQLWLNRNCPAYQRLYDVVKRHGENSPNDAVDAIKMALRIEPLWMPPGGQNDSNHDDEFAALASMRQRFREVVGSR